jgi:hypothetical protein
VLSFDQLEVRSLRTQQRAEDQATSSIAFQSPEEDVLAKDSASWSQCQCSTHERHRETDVPEMTWQLVPARADL